MKHKLQHTVNKYYLNTLKIVRESVSVHMHTQLEVNDEECVLYDFFCGSSAMWRILFPIILKELKV